MPEPLKNIYNRSFFEEFCTKVTSVYPDFDKRLFLQLLYDDNWESKELKERIRHISNSLKQTLPPSYSEALAILMKIAPACKGFEYLFFPDFVEVYGQGEWELSIAALEVFTESSSSEFAVRPFIERNQEKMIQIMMDWASHPNLHVRRLASEGCRPRLPWARPLLALKEDPSPILPILTALKEDTSEYVRKSVANNLNDISKDHPELVREITKQWKSQHSFTDWILKHGNRTLLRKGDQVALELFGFDPNPAVLVTDLTLAPKALSIGEELCFSFQIQNNSQHRYLLRMEYGVEFVKANGSTAKKLFKISENNIYQKVLSYSRTHSFKNLSTRRHYAGMHRLFIVINGVEMAAESFYLSATK